MFSNKKASNYFSEKMFNTSLRNKETIMLAEMRKKEVYIKRSR